MLFEGLSKGGNQLILLYIAYTLDPSVYLIFMLLVSLETFLPILVISNYNEVLYTLKGKFAQEKVFSTVLTITLISTFLFIFILYINQIFLFDYFNYSNIYVYLTIPISVFFIVYFKFLSMYYQLEESHSKAIYLKSLPFFLSFLGALIGVMITKDQVAGFFIGKAIGFTVTFFYFLLKDKIFTFTISINQDFLKEYLSRSKFLFLITFFGWLSTYGFLNIGKLTSTDENIIDYGYMINLYMLFLMIANGINQVYSPRIRKLFHHNSTMAYTLSKKTLLLYLTISVLAFVSYYFLMHLNSKMPFLNDKAIDILSVFPYAILVFAIAALKYISDVYVYVLDKYQHFALSLVMVEVLSISIAVILLLYFQVTLLNAYLILISSRSLYTFLYVKKSLKLWSHYE